MLISKFNILALFARILFALGVVMGAYVFVVGLSLVLEGWGEFNPPLVITVFDWLVPFIGAFFFGLCVFAVCSIKHCKYEYESLDI